MRSKQKERFHSFRDGFLLGARGELPLRISVRLCHNNDWHQGFAEGHDAYMQAMQACAERLGILVAPLNVGEFARETEHQERAVAIVDRVLRFLGTIK